MDDPSMATDLGQGSQTSSSCSTRCTAPSDPDRGPSTSTDIGPENENTRSQGTSPLSDESNLINRCEACDKFYTSRSILLRHLRGCTESRRRRCNYCDREFTTYNGVRLHEKRAHTLQFDNVLRGQLPPSEVSIMERAAQYEAGCRPGRFRYKELERLTGKTQHQLRTIREKPVYKGYLERARAAITNPNPAVPELGSDPLPQTTPTPLPTGTDVTDRQTNEDAPPLRGEGGPPTEASVPSIPIQVSPTDVGRKRLRASPGEPQAGKRSNLRTGPAPLTRARPQTFTLSQEPGPSTSHAGSTLTQSQLVGTTTRSRRKRKATSPDPEHASAAKKRNTTPHIPNEQLPVNFRPPVSQISNTTGTVFPVEWRDNRTILIHKSGDRTDPGNWRPITISSAVQRLFHRVLVRRIRRQVALDDHQRGFSEIDGCMANSIILDSYITSRRHQGKSFNIVCCDVRKAFDTFQSRSVGRNQLRNCDKLVRFAVRRILRLPAHSGNHLIHASLRDGGLGITSMEVTIPTVMSRRLQKLKTSGDVTIRAVLEGTAASLVARIEHQIQSQSVQRGDEMGEQPPPLLHDKRLEKELTTTWETARRYQHIMKPTNAHQGARPIINNDHWIGHKQRTHSPCKDLDKIVFVQWCFTDC